MTQRVLAVAFAASMTIGMTAGEAMAGQGGQQGQAQQQPSQPEAPPAFEEQVVVTASRVEEQLVNAPAAVSIINSNTIQNSPATNIGDLLRAVPGVNVTQVSARDININTRGATSTLATSQLALVDGRSIYLDFYGMVMWDFVPSNPREIKRIEVIRGPASAVWGANAMSGVVNVITKTPRELAAEGGSFLTIGVGGFPRSAQGVDRDAGSLFYVNGSHAQAANDKLAYKISAGYFTQDALPRPDRDHHQPVRHARIPPTPTRAPASRSSTRAWTTRSTTAPRSPSTAVCRGPRASSTPASAPSTSSRAPTSRTSRRATRRARAASRSSPTS